MKDTYDYLNEKCRIIYECYENQGFLKPKNKLENIAKSRYGFYFYILSMVTYQNDFDVLKLMITDTDFQNKFQSKSYQDYGVDAYFIDDENKTISLFNFKFKYYRENSEQQNSEINASKVFLSMVKESNDNGLEGNLKKAYKEIKKRNFQKFPKSFCDWLKLSSKQNKISMVKQAVQHAIQEVDDWEW